MSHKEADVSLDLKEQVAQLTDSNQDWASVVVPLHKG